MNLPIFLINLDGSDRRLASSKAQLDRLGLEFRRVPAFDGRNLAPKDNSAYDEAAALAFTGRPLNGGELGCFLSHRDCAAKFLKTEAPYGIVLEDDMQISDKAPKAINAMLEWLRDNEIAWDLINLGPASLKITTDLMAFEGTTLVRAHYFPVRTSGLIWSRRGAETFLADQRKIFAPVDNYFRDWMTRSNTGLSVSPALITQRDDGSEISEEGSARHKSGRTKGFLWLKQKRLFSEKVRAYRHKVLGG